MLQVNGCRAGPSDSLQIPQQRVDVGGRGFFLIEQTQQLRSYAQVSAKHIATVKSPLDVLGTKKAAALG